jgi:YggT family protein
MINALWLLLVVVSPILIFLFIFRLILTWFPEINLNQFPANLVAWPTEVVLKPTRKIIPTFGGVDMTPFIWVALVALVQEILVGQQGLLTLLKAKGF